MKISLTELKQMIKEAVRAKLNEGPKEIPIKMVLTDIGPPVVGSVTEDLASSLSLPYDEIEPHVQKGWELMRASILKDLDPPPPDEPEPKRRREVIPPWQR